MICFVGSGKTLAYLLPLYEKIYKHNKIYGPTDACNQPHGVLVTPSRELADQAFVSCENVILSQVVRGLFGSR